MAHSLYLQSNGNIIVSNNDNCISLWWSYDYVQYNNIIKFSKHVLKLFCTIPDLIYVCLFPFRYNMLLNVFNVILFYYYYYLFVLLFLKECLCAWLFESNDPRAFWSWVCCGLEWSQSSAVWLVPSAENWGFRATLVRVSGAGWI